MALSYTARDLCGPIPTSSAWASTAAASPCLSSSCFTGTLVTSPVTGTHVHICFHQMVCARMLFLNTNSWSLFLPECSAFLSLPLASVHPYFTEGLLHSIKWKLPPGQPAFCFPKHKCLRRMWRVCRQKEERESHSQQEARGLGRIMNEEGFLPKPRDISPGQREGGNESHSSRRGDLFSGAASGNKKEPRTVAPRESGPWVAPERDPCPRHNFCWKVTESSLHP